MARRRMATSKTKETAPKATRTAKAPNALTEAADDAQRKLLRAALKRSRWNLAHAAAELRLSGSPALIQYLKRLGMGDEYEAAKADGRIRAGARPKA